MTKSLMFHSALIGVTMLFAAPALAQDPPVVVETPAPTPAVVVVQQPAPAPAAAPSTLVVNNPSGRDEGRRSFYPGLIWGGVAVWGVAYTPVVIGAAVANDVCDASSRFCLTGREVLYIPFFGPFIAISGVSGRGTSTLRTLLVLDGAFQMGGLAMTLTGIILSAQSSRNHYAASRAARPVKERTVMVSPFVTATATGVGAMGRF